MLICVRFINKSYSEITGFLGNAINKHGRKTRVINLNGNKHKQAAKQRSHSATQSPPRHPAWSVITEGHYEHILNPPHFRQLSRFFLFDYLILQFHCSINVGFNVQFLGLYSHKTG